MPIIMYRFLSSRCAGHRGLVDQRGSAGRLELDGERLDLRGDLVRGDLHLGHLVLVRPGGPAC